MTPRDLAQSVGFDLPDRYNASRILYDNLDRTPDAPAVIADGVTLSYAELITEASRIGNALRASGCSQGDRVMLLMDDRPTYPAAIMGALRAGLVPLMINTLSTPDLVAFFLKDSDARAVIADADLADLLPNDAPPLLITEQRPWADAAPDLAEHPTDRRDMAFWMYSSGTTGRPKGIVHKHEDAAYTAQTYARHILRIGPDDRCFSIPKIFFAYGFGNSVTFPFTVGAASILLAGRPTPNAVFAQIDAHRPTILFGLPTLYTALVNDPGIDTVDMSSVRLCISAAEVLSPELAQDWHNRFGLPIVEGLGSTEVLHIYLSNDAEWQKPGSSGRAVPGYGVRLRTPECRDANPGEDGVMEVMGLSAAEYYWNRPDKTAETMRDGWVHTGDRFSVDADGFYYFKGRADDLVKVSGQWVYPLEIEHALNDHPQVREACVQAVELPDRRMTIKAWIAAKTPPDDALRANLVAFAKSRLLPHKYPREIVFLDTLPKTGTDKIDRQALKKME